MEEEHQHYIDKIFNNLIEQLQKLLSDFVKRLAVDGKAIESFANSDEYDIKPVIDIRNMWQGDKTRLLEGTDNVVYDNCANVYCYDLQTGQKKDGLWEF
ncbi:MAG: hypothetical protein R6V14_01200 [Halanaerobiales bacterium]